MAPPDKVGMYLPAPLDEAPPTALPLPRGGLFGWVAIGTDRIRVDPPLRVPVGGTVMYLPATRQFGVYDANRNLTATCDMPASGMRC